MTTPKASIAQAITVLERTDHATHADRMAAADGLRALLAEQQAAEPVVRCPQDIIDAITAYGDARADQDAINAPTTSHERLADCIRLVRGVLTKQMAHTQQPLTDEQIGEIGRNHEKFDKAGNEWFDRWAFARAIEAAHGITSKEGGAAC